MTSLIELSTAIFFNTPLSVNDSVSQNQQHARHACWVCCFSIPLLNLLETYLQCRSWNSNKNSDLSCLVMWDCYYFDHNCRCNDNYLSYVNSPHYTNMAGAELWEGVQQSVVTLAYYKPRSDTGRRQQGRLYLDGSYWPITKSLPSTRPADTNSWDTPSAVSEKRERERKTKWSERARGRYNLHDNIKLKIHIWKQCFGFSQNPTDLFLAWIRSGYHLVPSLNFCNAGKRKIRTMIQIDLVTYSGI